MVRISRLAALFALGACSPAVHVAPPVPPAKPTAKPVRPVESPSRWVLAPSNSTTFETRLELGAAGTLYVNETGERWLDKKTAGGLVAATTLLGSDLRGVVHTTGGKFLFVGASGTVFETDDPLGPAKAKRKSPKPLRLSTPGKASVVAVDAAGALVRSTDGGSTWAPVNAPKLNGVLTSLAMHASGLGLALAAPQQLLATDDDGANWKVVGSPGIGARRVALDANGELVLDGILGSAQLKQGPLRLERNLAAAHVGFELPAPEGGVTLDLAEAIRTGRGLLLADRYLELSPDPDGENRHRLIVVDLANKAAGFASKVRRMPDLDGCNAVSIGGNDDQIEIGCDRLPGENAPVPPPKWGKPGWNYNPPSYRPQVHLWKSTDHGEKFVSDGVLNGAERSERGIWVAPDGTLLVDGACKRGHNDWICDESPPIVRLPGAKVVAKAVSLQGTRFQTVVFGKQNAYALGTTQSGIVSLFVSKNGGKDFARKTLAAIPEPGGPGVIQPDGGGGVVAVEDSFVAVYLPFFGGLVRYVSTDDGATFKGSIVSTPGMPYVGAAGRRALIWDGFGSASESADGGETWTEVAAAAPSTVTTSDRPVVCNAWACVMGGRGIRVGWELAANAVGPVKATATPTTPKHVARTGIECAVQGEWLPEGPLPLPAVGYADLGGDTRWVLARRDPKTNAVVAIVQKPDAKGVLERKEVPLFAPDKSTDNAVNAVMQVEGVAAIKYAFKRDKAPKPATATPAPVSSAKPFGKPPPPPPTPFAAILPKQTVDVEVAWYVAATNKVYRGTIKGVGPLDPIRDVADGRADPSQARTFLLSIAPGGIHVRPLASSMPDQPLWFVSESGKVEKLTWPDVPQKDVRGATLNFHYDATRIGKRTVVFADAYPANFFVTWSNEAGGAWESRLWSLWPDADLPGKGVFRFLDSGVGTGAALGILYPGSAAHPPAAFGFVVKGNIEDDPGGLFPMPTQKSLGDPPKACGALPKDALRINVPFSTGTRHPVLVKGDGADRVLATSSAVLRTGPNGTGEPCMTMIEASPVPASAGDQWVALLPPGDLEHATLFRTRVETSVFRLSSRTLKCGWAKDMKLPDALTKVAGFTED